MTHTTENQDEHHEAAKKSLLYLSHPEKQTALTLSCFALGLILSIGFLHFNGPGMANNLAGFLLGLFLMLIGMAAFLAIGRQSITVLCGSRQIVVEDTTRFGSKKRVIFFRDIAQTGLDYLGNKSNLVSFYFIVLKLRNGESYPLFAPGRFYAGASDREVMEKRRQHIEACISQSSTRQAKGDL